METQALTYVFLGIMYTVLFIVVGTFLVHRKRKGEAREERLKQMAKGVPDEKEESDDGKGGVRRRKLAKDDDKENDKDKEEDTGARKRVGKKVD